MSGGLRHRTPEPFVHGYVMCDAMIEGTLAHSCRHGPAPHRIKVCLTRKGNESVWNDVLAIVGPRPGRGVRGGRKTISSPVPAHDTRIAQLGTTPSCEHDGAVIEVRREWNDWRIATFRLRDVSELRWSWRGGGTKRRTPQPFVHGYVMCNELLAGDLAHACPQGAAPHRIKVCLTRKGNEPIWKDVAAIVGPRPAKGGRRRTSRRSRRRLRPVSESRRHAHCEADP
jgi:hypothetical protein